MRTVDTDVVVNLLGKFHYLVSVCHNVNIWVAFGVGKSFSYIHVNTVYKNLGQEKSLALPVFHSFTVVTPHQHSMVEVKNLHGKHGTVLKK